MFNVEPFFRPTKDILSVPLFPDDGLSVPYAFQVKIFYIKKAGTRSQLFSCISIFLLLTSKLKV